MQYSPDIEPLFPEEFREALLRTLECGEKTEDATNP
jgi:hypothetical protein